MKPILLKVISLILILSMKTLISVGQKPQQIYGIGRVFKAGTKAVAIGPRFTTTPPAIVSGGETVSVSARGVRRGLSLAELRSTGVTTNALTINLSFAPDATFTSAGLSAADIPNMKAACIDAANEFISNYNDPINLNFNVTATSDPNVFGQSSFGLQPYSDYNTMRAALVTDSKSADDNTALGTGGSIATSDPVAGSHDWWVTRAEAKALALITDDLNNDGTFTFNGTNSFTYDPANRAVTGKYDFIGVALHEFSEIMGRTWEGGSGDFSSVPSYLLHDIFRYKSPGVRGFTNGDGIFFSIDGGTNLLKQENPLTDGSDPDDWAPGTNDAFNNAEVQGTMSDLSAVDLTVMDVLGYDRGTTATATTMTPNAGTTPQSTAISTAFTNPLAVTVKDAGGNPVNNVNVTFTAPGTGASGIFSNSTATITVATNISGVASASFTANATAGGPYNVAASSGVLTPVNFSLTNSTNGQSWSTTGNSGTVDGTNFIGTTDNVPFNIRVNNFQSGRIDPTLQNTFYGYRAGILNTTGGYNASNGNYSLFINSTGSYNIANGYSALYNNTSGNYNVANGFAALNSNTTGGNNMANGANSLRLNTTGSYNVANGYGALYSNTTGTYNMANGSNALYYNTTGSYNIATGANALIKNTTGIYNIATGYSALYNNTTGNYNLATGYSALYNNTTGIQNTADGYQSLYSNSVGSNLTAVGYRSLYSNTTGTNNTAIGLNALLSNITGSNNTALGYGADVATGALTNATAIGNGAIVNASNTIQLGNSSITNIDAQVTGFTSLSDRRFKKNIKEDVPGLEFIKLLRPVTYNYDIKGFNTHIKGNTPPSSQLPGTDAVMSEALSKTEAPQPTEADRVGVAQKEKIEYTGLVAQEVEKAANKVGYDFSGLHKPQNCLLYTPDAADD